MLTRSLLSAHNVLLSARSTAALGSCLSCYAVQATALGAVANTCQYSSNSGHMLHGLDGMHGPRTTAMPGCHLGVAAPHATAALAARFRTFSSAAADGAAAAAASAPAAAPAGTTPSAAAAPAGAAQPEQAPSSSAAANGSSSGSGAQRPRFSQLLAQLQQQGASLTDAQLVDVLHTMASQYGAVVQYWPHRKLRQLRPQLQIALAEASLQLQQRLPGLTGELLSQSMWGVMRLSGACPDLDLSPLWAAYAQRIAQPSLSGMGPKQLSTFMLCCSKVLAADKQVFGHAAQQMVPLLPQADALALSRALQTTAVVYGSALDEHAQRLVNATVRALVDDRRMEQLDVKGWAVVLPALVSMRLLGCEPLFTFAADKLQGWLAANDAAPDHTLCNVLHAYASVGMKAEGLKVAGPLVQQVLAKKMKARSHDWYKLYWALAELEAPGTEQLFDLGATSVLPGFLSHANSTPEDIASVFWAYARLKHAEAGRKLAAAVLPKVGQRFKAKATPEQAEKLQRACGELGVDLEGLAAKKEQQPVAAPAAAAGQQQQQQQ